MSETANKQVKSKQRVADHGEVFTAEREVNAMLDLVKQQTESIDATFLEPACGNGNFLAEILRRKLAAVDKENYSGKRCLTDSWEMDSVKAVMSIYGVDLLQDNVDECRERLFTIWNDAYTKACKKACDDVCRETVRFVLERNILCGNALDLCRVDDQGNPLPIMNNDGSPRVNSKGEPEIEPIIFCEWGWSPGGRVKRRDFRLDVLMKENKDPNAYENTDTGMQLSFLDGDASNAMNWQEDPEDTKNSIAAPVHECDIIFFKRIQEQPVYVYQPDRIG